MTIPPAALGPRDPYDEWFEGLNEQHQPKELLRALFLQKAEAGEEIPMPVIFERDTTRWVFEFECPCLLWPDDLPNKQRSALGDAGLEGSFRCKFCGREWFIQGWRFLLEDHQEEWHPRLLYVCQSGTVGRVRLLSFPEELPNLTPDSRVSPTMKLALLLRTLDDE